MIRVLFSFIVVIFCLSLFAPFEGAYASKREARESVPPVGRYHYDIISPFGDTSAFGVKPQKPIQNDQQQQRRNFR